MFGKALRNGLTGSLALFVTVLAMTSLAGAATYTAHLDGPIVIGDQLFGGGEVRLVDVAAGSPMVAIVIDGRQVALCERQTRGTRPNGSRPALVVEYDSRGFQHIVGIEFRMPGSDDPAVAFRALRPVTVARGLATVPPHRLDAEAVVADASSR
ncbi:MAG: hypothetical protein Kow0062_20170 [Acidobacteriota bacterium]|nr:MAG: hypothetical protein D6738_07800 [Acidobacteriota bacterium]